MICNPPFTIIDSFIIDTHPTLYIALICTRTLNPLGTRSLSHTGTWNNDKDTTRHRRTAFAMRWKIYKDSCFIITTTTDPDHDVTPKNSYRVRVGRTIWSIRNAYYMGEDQGFAGEGVEFLSYPSPGICLREPSSWPWNHSGPLTDARFHYSSLESCMGLTPNIISLISTVYSSVSAVWQLMDSPRWIYRLWVPCSKSLCFGRCLSDLWYVARPYLSLDTK